MRDIISFLGTCNTLTGSQPLARIIYKARKLIEDPAYWCPRHKACIRWRCQTTDGFGGYQELPCRINDPRATCLDIQGAVGRACNNYGIIPPFLLKYLDECAVSYARNLEPATDFGDTSDIWSPFDLNWFTDRYTHEHALGLLDMIHESVK